MCGCSGGGGHAWLLLGGTCVVVLGGVLGCSKGGVHSCSWGGMCGCFGGACVVAPGGHAWDTMKYGDTINEQVVRILLECILVFYENSTNITSISALLIKSLHNLKDFHLGIIGQILIKVNFVENARKP